MPTHRPHRVLGALVLGLSLTLTATACGSDSDPEPTTALSSTQHNDADVSFATDMLQHHAQALSMVDLTAGRPLDPAVARLADDIRSAQAPEIENFVDWLTAWGEPIPETMRDHANAGHAAGDMADSMKGLDADMPGMMTAEDMTALEDAADADFQSRWLEMMIAHHEGAVEMARTEIDGGRHRPAVELAKTIVDSQSEQVDTMKGLLR